MCPQVDQCGFRLRIKGYRFKRFQPLCDALCEALKGHRAILDDGRSIFTDLMWQRAEPRYAAFDLMWLDGRDLRSKPLIERKQLLRKDSYRTTSPQKQYSRANSRSTTQLRSALPS